MVEVDLLQQAFAVLSRSLSADEGSIRRTREHRNAVFRRCCQSVTHWNRRTRLDPASWVMDRRFFIRRSWG
jgi:hypothetical protein